MKSKETKGRESILSTVKRGRPRLALAIFFFFCHDHLVTFSEFNKPLTTLARSCRPTVLSELKCALSLLLVRLIMKAASLYLNFVTP